ncbi:hypothetical protein EDE12_1322 [Methylosinus sp. sav-2]|uniref:hypothetical protein n=1 Tax=Methylosinus sp. sav-2 TaxID=2485168 RepID=UPI0010EB68EE|nr:hypothetical protein [Methylosinus sp. sav-2]TDX59560.1 hypothetical protein EDE12_1322 [Methylosinus sp. sav-2]
MATLPGFPLRSLAKPAFICGLSSDSREASEARRLSSFEAAEFWHFDEQGESREFRDSGDGEENFEPASEERIAFDALFDCGVYLHDFRVDFGDALFVPPFEQRKRDRLRAVRGGGAVFDERGSRQMQFFQLGDGLADARARLEVESLSHARQHGGVGTIGFDELAGGLGEAARVARIDFGYRQTGYVERAFTRAMVRAGGLEHDTLHRRGAHPFDQGLSAGLVIGETARGSVHEVTCP